MNDIIKQILKKTNYVLDENIKKLGSGSDGEIYEIKFKGSKRVLAAKLIKNVNEKTEEKLEIIQNLRGYNIIRIEEYLESKKDGKKYTVIIMEKAVLRDLEKLSYSYFYHNLLKLQYIILLMNF